MEEKERIQKIHEKVPCLSTLSPYVFLTKAGGERIIILRKKGK